MAESTAPPIPARDVPPSRRGLVLILIGSLALKLALLVPAHQTIPVRDAASYVQTARLLCTKGEYTGGRSPAYPAMLCGAFWLASLIPSRPGTVAPRLSPLDVARLIQVLLSTLTVWLIYHLGRALFDDRAALVAAGLFAFYPDFVGFSHLLWAETQLVFLNACWVLCLVRGLRTARVSLLCAAGALFALAAMTRMVVFSFLPLAIAWMFLVRPVPWQTTAKLAAAMALSTAVVISPWTIRNAVVHHAFVAIAPNEGWALLWGASDDFFADLRAAGLGDNQSPVERDRRAGARALEIIRDDPAAYLNRLVRRNLPGMWTPGSMVLQIPKVGAPPKQGLGYPAIPGWLGRVLLIVFVGSYLAVMPFAILGGALAPDWRTTLLSAALALHGTALHTIAGGFNRHRLYLMAFAILYAGFFLSRRPSELRALVTRRRAVVAIGVTAAVAAVIAASDLAVVVATWRYFGPG